MRVKAVKGVQDLLPPETDIWRFLEDHARATFELFGFREVRTPLIERTEVFSRGIGETTDIVEKEMYTFPDKAGRSITLRPEGTASVVRAYVEHHLDQKNPVTKLYYTGPMFRYERPQAGRYRQFHQIGVEAFGSDDPRIDAEIIQMLGNFLESVGLKDVEIQINSIGCADCRPEYREAVHDFLAPKIEGFCADCRRRLETNPLRILDCKVPSCIEKRRGVPSILQHLDDDCREHFDRLLDFLKALNVSHTVNPNLVRGLDYYTRTTFEAVARGLGAQNAVAAGGRYDDLVKTFGGPPTPAIGFAMGIERLALLCGDAVPRTPGPQAAVVALGAAAEKEGLLLASAFRSSGARAELTYGGSLKSQMRRADKTGARFVVIIGDDELARGAGQVKDLDSGEQTDVPFAEIPAFVRAALNTPAPS